MSQRGAQREMVRARSQWNGGAALRNCGTAAVEVPLHRHIPAVVREVVSAQSSATKSYSFQPELSALPCNSRPSTKDFRLGCLHGSWGDVHPRVHQASRTASAPR